MPTIHTAQIVKEDEKETRSMDQFVGFDDMIEADPLPDFFGGIFRDIYRENMPILGHKEDRKS